MNISLSVETRIFNATDTSTPLCTLQKEFDVSQFDVFSQAELAAVTWGREAETLVLGEVIKKKTRFWLPHLLSRILNWLRTGSGRSASAGLPIWHRTPGSD